MSHRCVKIAEEVVNNAMQYPTCIVALALEIIKWSNSHRVNIEKLWTLYRTPYRKYVAETHGHVKLIRMRIGNQVLKEHGFVRGSDQINDFYLCKSSVRDSPLFLTFPFENLLAIFNLDDLEPLYQFLAAINSGKSTDTVPGVKYIESTNPIKLAEILSFRLLQNPRKET